MQDLVVLMSGGDAHAVCVNIVLFIGSKVEFQRCMYFMVSKKKKKIRSAFGGKKYYSDMTQEITYKNIIEVKYNNNVCWDFTSQN